MEDLKRLLIDRAATQSGHTPPPPAGGNERWKRWENAQEMINGFQNGWSPNPVLGQMLKGK
jgi:hypothetical protein